MSSTHDGVVHTERHLDQSHSERRDQVDPLGQHVTDAAEGHSAPRVLGIEDERSDDVEMGGRRFERREAAVESAQPLHR